MTVISVAIFLIVNAMAAAETNSPQTNATHSAYDTNVENVFDPDHVRILVLQLAHEEHSSREKAQVMLEKLPHTAIGLIRECADQEDPEVSERVKQVLSKIQKRAARIPEYVLEWAVDNTGEYRKAMQKWRKKHVPATGEIDTHVWMHDVTFAQSFIPRCQKIDAIALEICPLKNHEGWLRLDLHADLNGRPAPQALARCWIRFRAKGPVPEGGWTLFDMPDTMVDAKKTYWFVMHQHSMSGQDHFCAWLMSDEENPENEDYIDGKLWRKYEDKPMQKSDACFRVYDNASELPVLRNATKKERRSLPSVQESRVPWGMSD